LPKAIHGLIETMNHSNPVVSVIIPTYNQANLLQKALESVINQAFQDWEAIVIDNYSDDNTQQVVESRGDSRIKYIRFRNNGIIAASRNLGIAHSTGEYIAFLDSDDLWYPSKLSTCLFQFSQGADSVCHGMWIRKDGKLWKKFIPQQPKCDFYDTLLFEGNSTITTSTVVLKRDCLLKFGAFCEDQEIVTAEDYDLWLRLLKNNISWKVVPQILGEYTMHSSNSSNNIRRQMKSEETVFLRELKEIKSVSLMKKFRMKKRLMMIAFRAGRRVQQGNQWIASLPFFIRGLSLLFKQIPSEVQ
jgi:glycosyltransferase involved in cell wall biosynthesis